MHGMGIGWYQWQLIEVITPLGCNRVGVLQVGFVERLDVLGIAASNMGGSPLLQHARTVCHVCHHRP